MQSRGERLGAATWRSLAEHSEDDSVRNTYLDCAKLEEESAVVLEIGSSGAARRSQFLR